MFGKAFAISCGVDAFNQLEEVQRGDILPLDKGEKILQCFGEDGGATPAAVGVYSGFQAGTLRGRTTECDGFLLHAAVA